jgi:hypothetical protein
MFRLNMPTAYLELNSLSGCMHLRFIVHALLLLVFTGQPASGRLVGAPVGPELVIADGGSGSAVIVVAADAGEWKSGLLRISKDISA